MMFLSLNGLQENDDGLTFLVTLFALLPLIDTVFGVGDKLLKYRNLL